ncbi:nuclear envelope integral membrane protein 1 isoform X2 [Stigmatopora nigra]
MAGCTKHRKQINPTVAHSFLLTLLILCLAQQSSQYSGVKTSIINLKDGEEHHLSGSSQLCYKNSVIPNWRQTWTRIQVRIWSSEVFRVETVQGEDELRELERFSAWNWLQNWLQRGHNETTINVHLFSNRTCFKIVPSGDHYTVKSVRKFDVYLFVVFLLGVLLFFFADSLSRSQVFFYSAGTGTGIMASLIILFFILARLLPKKSPFYILIVGGWSFSVYAIQLVCRNLNVILREHWHTALGYMGVVGFISFAVCYRYGPLVDEKSINILSWTLQLLSMLLIYLGNQIHQVSFAIMAVALLAKNLGYPIMLALVTIGKIRQYIDSKPQKRRLLTMVEYRKQGEEETVKALEGLRSFCSSPDCNPWKAVSRLQSPKRFADFIEGSSHLLANEASMHAHEYGWKDFFDTDDEDDQGDQGDQSGLCQNHHASFSHSDSSFEAPQ